MELKNLPWYGQLAVFLIIGGLLFIAFYMFYYSDNQSKIKRMTGNIDKLDKEIRALERKKSKIKEMRAAVESNEAMLEKLKEILPEKNEISQIIKKIQSIITTARLDILDWTTRKPSKKKIYVQHPISIRLDGNYHNIGMFFDQLSKLKKIFTVDNLTIRPKGKKMDRTFTVSATFTASTYTFRETKKKTAKKGATKKRRRRRH